MSKDLSTSLAEVGSVLRSVMDEYRQLDERVERLLREREEILFAPWPKTVIYEHVCKQIDAARIRFSGDLSARLRDLIFPSAPRSHEPLKQITGKDLLRELTPPVGPGSDFVSAEAVLALCSDIVKSGYRDLIDAMDLPMAEGLDPAARATRLEKIDTEIDRLEKSKASLVADARAAGLEVSEQVVERPTEEAA